MLGGGEVMADALASGTPLIGTDDGGLDEAAQALNKTMLIVRVINIFPCLIQASPTPQS
jgi:hypothetical protein